jgi:hypothetical protein
MTLTADTSSQRAGANRRNVRRGTGPRTQAGKDRSRFHALKHGMCSKLPILPSDDADPFRARLASGTITLEPRDDLERHLVQRAVHVSPQLRAAQSERFRGSRVETHCLGRPDGV